MTLTTLFYTSIFAMTAWFLWQHMGIGQRALQIAKAHTERIGVRLLDQSVHLKSIKIRPSNASLFALQRCYEFEFSTRGDQRYKGWVTYIGNRQQDISLQAFVDQLDS